MAGNAKRITKKLKAVEEAFAKLPMNLRKRVVFEAIAEVSGVKPERAASHWKLALCLLEAAPAVLKATAKVSECFEGDA